MSSDGVAQLRSDLAGIEEQLKDVLRTAKRRRGWREYHCRTAAFGTPSQQCIALFVRSISGANDVAAHYCKQAAALKGLELDHAASEARVAALVARLTEAETEQLRAPTESLWENARKTALAWLKAFNASRWAATQNYTLGVAPSSKEVHHVGTALTAAMETGLAEPSAAVIFNMGTGGPGMQLAPHPMNS